jgi:hypothetical protein
MTENQENNLKAIEFPPNIEDLSTEDCAKILRKALSLSKKYKTQTDISKATNINGKSIGDYFTARHKPSQERWTLLRETLFQEGMDESLTLKRASEAIHSIERLKAILILLKDELEYLKNSTRENRKILKEQIPGNQIGYLASLLTALYDESQLEIFKNFSSKNQINGKENT